jgi:hypothetical protein
MTITVGICEKNIVPILASPQAIAAGVAADVIPNNMNNFESFAYINVQNAGANDCYYAFGQDCSAVAYHGVLAPYSSVPVPAPCRVSVYSAAGTTIAVTIFKRIGAV